MANPDKKANFQVPLMYAFRDAFDRRDAGKKLDERVDGERLVAARGAMKRRGTEEALLKRNLVIDLLALVNTVDLASTIDLEGFDHVGRSILNFGLHDIAHLTSDERGVESIAEDLARTLLQHEPRLIPETLHVERSEEFDDVNQRIRFSVSAEMSCTPLDVPIDFIAEVEVGSGKVLLTRLPVAV